MTKKKRELIEILLDNVKPENWPEHLPHAAQDIKSMNFDNPIYAYQCEPVNSDVFPKMWNQSGFSTAIKIGATPKELCKFWNKTIVHRDEFMKRWNERNRVFVSITDQHQEEMDSAKYEALEFTEIGGDVEKTLTFSREGIAPVVVTEKMEKISIKPEVDSEGWIKWNGGEMPVEKGTLIDVKYRRGLVNLHVKAGEVSSCGSIPDRYAIDFKHDDNPGDIIAYRLHVTREQKTPQQLALEKFGTDWHENEGETPLFPAVVKIDIEFKNGIIRTGRDSDDSSFEIPFEGGEGYTVTRWRIHSDEKESQINKAALLREPMPPCSEEIPCHFVDEKSPLETQIGGDHYTKLAIQPMQYSMKNGLDALQHTVIKYVTRFRDKAGIEDLEKAKHCIDMLIEFEKENK